MGNVSNMLKKIIAIAVMMIITAAFFCPGSAVSQTILNRNANDKEAASAFDFIDSPFGILDANPQFFEYYEDLGIHWIKTGFRLGSWEDIERQKGKYDFSGTDRQLQNFYNRGLNVFIELRPINRLYGTDYREDGPESMEYPEDTDAYLRFIKNMVKRYSNKEKDLKKINIEYYQLVHELPPLFIKPDYWRKHPANYAKMFRSVHKAIKEVCSDCRLFLPGGDMDDYKSKGEGVREDGFIVKVLKEFQKSGGILSDIGFDYHIWSNPSNVNSKGEDYQQHIKHIDTIRSCYKKFGYKDSDVGIISGECGMAGRRHTERYQASYLVKIFVTSVANGQKKLFWTSTMEYGNLMPSDIPEPPLVFLHTGLIHNPRNANRLSHKKLAYYSYKLLVETLQNADFNNIKTLLNGKNNVYAYLFVNKISPKPIIIAWWDYFKENQDNSDKRRVSLNIGLKNSKFTVMSAIPEGKDGYSIKTGKNLSYGKRTISSDSSGNISLELMDIPVYIIFE